MRRRSAVPRGARSPRPIIALLTDYGTRDWYAAVMKAIILSRVPHAQLVDITHEIPPQDVTAGAFILAAAVAWFPAGTIFVCVVDPRVGSRRALLAAEADGRYFLGPDNGLLSLALARARRRRIIRLTNHRLWLPAISRTFHGRDILAPVAASLACGGSWRRLGTPVHQIQTLEAFHTPLVHRAGALHGRIVHIDRFGNLITNLPATRKTSANPETSRVHYRGRAIRVVSSYDRGRPREPIAVIGSLGMIELAVRNGSAAKRLNARRGDPVVARLRAS